MIVNAGIKKIFIRDGYPDKFAREILKEAKIELITVPSKTPPPTSSPLEGED